MAKDKKKKIKGKHLCNLCETVRMGTITMLQCPNCQSTGYEEKCENCNSEMKEVELLSCPDCGNIMDEKTLKDKWEIKKKFAKLKK